MKDYEHLAAHTKGPLYLADHNLNSNLILGLEEASGSSITLINNTPIRTFPSYPKIFFHRQSWSHGNGSRDVNCGFINLPILKHLSRAVTTFTALRRIIKDAEKGSVCIFTYELHVGISLAVLFIKRFYPAVHTCAVLPDIPDLAVLAHTQGKDTLGGRFRAAVKTRFIRHFEMFVVLTKYMQELPVFAGKPSVIIEGIYNDTQGPLPESTSEKKIILYTGTLNPAYGIENLINAFLQLYRFDQDYELWFCGGGSLEKRIQNLEKQCPGLRNFGYVNTDKVRECQAQATVLVNPRQNNDTLARYAFPSKTMEYLASGRPVVGYKLDGIPEEYDAYIQYVPDDSLEALRDKLKEVCELSKEQRAEIGKRSREFILQKKNPKVMGQQILDMWKEACADADQI